MALTVETFAAAMGNSVSLDRYRQLFPAAVESLRACQCNTVNRAAMWLAQVGHESGGLRWMEELASGAAYEWRSDLGNTQAGDGVRFKGRGPIQITGRYNYRKVSEWAHAQGIVPTPTYFVDNPTQLASDQYGFIGVSWYWQHGGPRPGQINGFADAGDILSGSRCVNGWVTTPNGMPDRTERWNRCRAMGDAIVPADAGTDNRGDGMAWTGDPVWLEDVLRPVLGDRLRVLPSWQQYGHGDFKDIRGVMVHHTGNANETAESIRRGRPDLAGPLANIHIAPNGTVTLVAAGVCWHAGAGSYPWLPTNNANWHMIGIECAWPTIRPNGTYDENERWPDAQIIAMRDTCAALTKRLGWDASRVIGHKEYAGAAQGKWDPGNLDMGWFRGEVAKAMRGEFDPKVPANPPADNNNDGGSLLALTDQQQHDLYNAVMGIAAVAADIQTQLRGPGLRGWPQLGRNAKGEALTVVDALAAVKAIADREGGR